jgi:hypothetical protein
MAVWIYAYGKNGIKEHQKDILDILNKIDLNEVKILEAILEITQNNESIEKHYAETRASIEAEFKMKTDEEYEAYLESVNFPKIDRNKLVDYFISEGLERERKEKELFERTYTEFKNGTIKSNWEKDEDNTYYNKLCNFSKHNGLKITLLNDLISIVGPFEIFSVYLNFQKNLSNHSREYFHSLFKLICKAFKSDFILYTHEWAGLDDEDDREFDLKKLKEQADWENTSGNSIHTMKDFYFEKL